MTPQEPAIMPDPSRDSALAELLGSLFDDLGLRRFLHNGPEGAALSGELPGTLASHAELAHQAVLCLIRRGLVNQELFDRLRAERPKRAAEIEAVYQRWSGHLQPSPPIWASRAARPMLMSALGLLLLIVGWALFLREMEPGTPTSTGIGPQAPATVLPTDQASAPAPSPTEPLAAEPKTTLPPPDPIPAPSTVTIKADGDGSTAVGGNLKASADKVAIEASDGATGVEKDANITATDATVNATSGATGIQGDAIFEANGPSPSASAPRED
jgi:cytoskeletal protein RodZ